MSFKCTQMCHKITPSEHLLELSRSSWLFKQTLWGNIMKVIIWKNPSIWRWQISSRVYLQQHNVTILGPGLLHPVTRILALTGAGLLAEGVKLHTTIFNEDNVKLPYAPSGVTSNKQQLKRRPKLMPPETNAPCLKCQNLLPIPPVVWNSILQATSSKAPSLILVISAAMQEFIKNSTTIKACETI